MDKFVTVEKNPSVDWGKIQMPFIKFVQGFDKSLLPKEEVPAALGKEEENELLMKINAFLDQRVRPALAGDGGGLQVLGIDGYMLRIRYQGACGSCPSAISGTLNAIENLLKREINPAIEVIPG
jgi:Fe-S cluster biogenesis protein NfuA